LCLCVFVVNIGVFSVAVYYNPDDPAEAVLERRAPANFWLLVSIVLVVLSLGSALVFVYGWG